MGAGQLIVEVVAVGTELLLGEIVNTNAAVIGRRLGDAGFDIHHQVVVGDNLGRLVETLRLAVSRSDAVVVTGGIGPTDDDLTREALCELAGVSMVRDESHAAWLTERIRAQGREPTPNVLKMSDLPEGAEGMPNSNGAAIGIALQVGGCRLYAIPGVPAEMVTMLDTEVLPRLNRSAGMPATLRSRTLHCWGLGEAAIGDRLHDLFASSNPTLAYLVDDMEVRVRITAKDRDEPSAMARIAPMELEVRRRLEDVVFGVDDETVEQIVVHALQASGRSLGIVDRATQGRVAGRIAAVDSGGVLAGAVVPGSAAMGVPVGDVILELGRIDAARTAGAATRAVEIAVTTTSGETRRTFQLGGDDERVRAFATSAGLHTLRKSLAGGL